MLENYFAKNIKNRIIYLQHDIYLLLLLKLFKIDTLLLTFSCEWPLS